MQGAQDGAVADSDNDHRPQLVHSDAPATPSEARVRRLLQTPDSLLWLSLRQTSELVAGPPLGLLP